MLISRRNVLLGPLAALGCGGESMRSVENKSLTVPLNTGMNEASGQRSGMPGLYRVENLRIRSEGTLQKRCGTDTLSGATVVYGDHDLISSAAVPRPTEHPAFVASVGEQEIAGTTAGDAFTFSDQWAFAGCFSTMLPTGKQTTIPGADAFNDLGIRRPGVAVDASGYVCTAAVMQDSTIAVTVVDPNGRCVYTDSISSITSAVPPRVLLAASVFYVVWENSANIVTARALTVTNGAVSASADTAVAGSASVGFWDASGFGSYWILAWENAGNTISVQLLSGLSIQDLDTLTTGSAFAYVSVWADATRSRVWVGWVEDVFVAANVYFATFTAAGPILSPDVPATLLDAGSNAVGPPLFGPSYRSPTHAATYAFNRVSGSSPGICSVRYGQINIDGSIKGVQQSVSHVAVVTKPDKYQRIWCVAATDGEQDENGSPFSYVLLRLEDAGSTASESATPIEATTGLLPNIGTQLIFNSNQIANDFHEVGVVGSDYVAALAIPVATMTDTAAITGDIQSFMQAQVFKYSDESHRCAKVSGVLGLVVAGQPVELGGALQSEFTISAGSSELGIGQACAIIDVGTGAGALPAGSYAYKAVAQWSDTLGNRHLGKPSAPVVVELSEPGKNSLRVTVPDIGQRTEDLACTALLYRTTAGGQNYQLLPLEGVVTGSLAVFDDEVTDETLAANEFLYTDGGVLPNVLAPTCRFLAVAEDRLWCGGLWDQTILEASKIRVPGEPWNFTGDPTHQVVLPEPCTGIAYMDGQVVAFAKNAVYLIGGDGPNDQGAGGFLPPRLLTRGVGCTNYASILETPIGVFFQSQIGLYLLPRGFGAPQYIGLQVQDTLSAYPVILSAAFTSSAEYNLARFLIGAEEATYAQRVLTFDLDSGQWFLDTYQAAGTASAVTYGSFSEIGPWPTGLALMRYDLNETVSPFWYEASEDAFDDQGGAEVTPTGSATVGDGFVATVIQTAWIYPFGMGGWGRLNKVILSMDHVYGATVDTAPQNVTVLEETEGFDNDASESLTSSIVGSSSKSATYIGFDIKRRDCTSVRTTVTGSKDDAAAGGAQARGPKYLALSYEAVGDGGLRMLKDGERS